MRTKSQNEWAKTHPERVKEMKRRSYLKNRDKYRAYKKKKYLQDREKILKKWHENYIPHPRKLKTKEEIISKRRLWVERNRSKLNEDSLKRRNRNLEKYQQYARGYYREHLSYKAQFGRLCINVRQRKLNLSLSCQEFTDIVSKSCNYCGEDKERRGIDRVDNLAGYTKENSTACCKICNYMKKTFTRQDFLYHIEKIYLYNKLK